MGRKSAVAERPQSGRLIAAIGETDGQPGGYLGRGAAAASQEGREVGG